MRSDKAIIFILPVMVILTSLLIPEAMADNDSVSVASLFSSEGYMINGGKIFRTDETPVDIPPEGEILGISESKGILYYIRESEGAWFAGRYDGAENSWREMPAGSVFAEILKLHSSGEVFYSLAELPVTGESGSKERVLARFDYERDEIKTINGVDDFIVSGEKLVLVTSAGLNCNGTVIPLSPGDRKFIKRIIDGRFVFVSDGKEVELIDLLAERNIYIYREGKVFPYSSEYNVIIEFNDISGSSDTAAADENMIYYQITLNGLDAGRTETGPGEVMKSSRLKAETGRYSVFTAERWELDKIKGRYVRVNNIYQPGDMKLFVPENRIIKIRVDFDGSRYTLNQSVYEN